MPVSEPTVFTREELERRSTVIASIYPKALYERRPHTPISSFHLPAAPCPYQQGVYTSLVIPDCFTMSYGGENVGNTKRLVPSAVVADDMYNCWVRMTPRVIEHVCAPGILILKGEVPNAEELAHMITMQEAYANSMIEQANEFHRDGKNKFIQPIHRTLAQWLQISDLPWLPESHGKRKNCPACKSLIDSSAYICPVCTMQIAELPKELVALNPGLKASKKETVHV